MLLFYYILLAYHILHGNSQYEESENESPPKCEDILEKEKSKASLKSLFHHVFKTGCLVCAKPECNYEEFLCPTFASFGLEPMYRIPLYNNILEFGLSGIYFPDRVQVFFKFNDKCFFKVFVWQHPREKKINLRIEECNKNNISNNCKKAAADLSFSIENKRQFCFYFGLALYENDRIYTTATADCDQFASALFNVKKFIRIKNRNCYFDKEKDKPIASYRFFQDKKRTQKIIGIPVVLPCNPGGFVVDPSTGRFVYGENCLKMFSNSEEEGKGINFLIKKIYNNNEHLKFPYRYGKKIEFFRMPIYLDAQYKGKERRLMAVKNETNLWIKDKVRDTCEFRAKRTPSRGRDSEGNAKLIGSHGVSAEEKGGEETNDSDILSFNNNVLISAHILFLLRFGYFK